MVYVHVLVKGHDWYELMIYKAVWDKNGFGN